jgi:Na+-translocating ferredoxin:NAD+ oxidoreductase RnfD subunit
MLSKFLQLNIFRDARNIQILSLSTFLLYGVWFLNWKHEISNFLILFPTAMIVQLLGIWNYKLPIDSIKSALITTLGLTLLLKTNDTQSLIIAASIAIASKFILRFKGKHIFNPANIGIVASITFIQQSWVSPGQWGSSILLLLMIGSAGIMVLTKAGRIDTGIAFLITLFTLDFFRIIVYQGWEMDVLMHKYMNGSLLLFSFFMITDPATTPNHKKARIIWASGVALFTFYLQSFVQLHTAPIWALFFISPLTIIFDRMLKANKFEWFTAQPVKAGISITILISFIFQIINPQFANAFCGFYVAKADTKLFNKASQVILVRDGEKSTITMNSDFQGSVKDFAMVVPVPVVLKRDQIRISDASLFRSLDDYSGPRLVEYYDENPCYPVEESDESVMRTTSSPMSNNLFLKKESTTKNKVKIEAQYVVGEYDILILSAKESNGLRIWLTENGYKIPDGANEVLEPYIKSNMKFFVVKVNLEEQKKLGFESLRPIQISFNSPKFMLPIRLGMANSNGDQDMIVYAFSKTGRVECTNYRTIEIPTNRNVPLDVEGKFGKFYKSLFDRTWNRAKDAVYLEYAWNVTPSWRGMKCDPCVGPPPLTADLSKAGVEWAQLGEQVYFTRLHVRYGRTSFPQDLQFQETPNRDNFQGRYILTHPAQGDLSCQEGQNYLVDLIKKRQREVQNLASLTGWNTENYKYYLNEYVQQIKDPKVRKNLMAMLVFEEPDQNDQTPNNMTPAGFTLLLTILVLMLILINNKKKEPTNLIPKNSSRI